MMVQVKDGPEQEGCLL